jgi:hypothetical protein
MIRARIFLLNFLFIVGVLPVALAQSGSISIPAWIEEGNCGPTPKFEATFNGRPAAVESPMGPGSDQIILLVLDFTGDVSLVDAAKQALAGEVSKLPDNIWVGVLSDQDGLRVLADPGDHRGPVTDAINNLVSSGKPGFLDSVTAALGLGDDMMRKSPVRVSVLYITDSNIYNYREDYTNPVINGSDPHDLSRVFPDALIQDKISKLEEAVSTLEDPLFVVHLNYRGDTLNEAYENGLLSLADITGGRGQLCRSVAEIPDAIASMFVRIANSWRLTLSVPPKFHNTAQIHLSTMCDGEEARLSWRTRVRPRED